MIKSLYVLLVALTVQLVFVSEGLAHPSRRCIDVFRSYGVRKLYRTDVNGQPIGVKRKEKLFGRDIEVVNITIPAKGIVKLSDIFNGDVTFLGFEESGVYLGTSDVSSDGRIQPKKFSATSLRRGDSEVQPTDGQVEQGLLIVFKDLPPSAQERIFEAAKKHEGSRRWTCANANCRLLADSGFTTSRTTELSDYYFTRSMLKAVLNKELHYSGYRVKFDVVRITSAVDPTP